MVFPNGSNVSIYPILRSKKDADKAVAYKALTIGVERLLNAVITIPEDRDEDLKMMMCLLNTEKGQGDVVPPPVNRPVVSQPMTEAPSQPIKPSESTHIIRRTIDNGVVQDSDGYIKVPFVFPSSSEVPDVVSVLHNSCMESMTKTTGVRLRIGAGVDECVDERTGVMSRLQRSRSRSFPVAPQPSRRHAGEGAESSILHSLFRRDAALLSPTLRDHRRRLATD